MKSIISISTYLLLILFFSTCQHEENKNVPQLAKSSISGSLFKQIPFSQSNIKMKNEVKETELNNIISNNYIYSGGGVAVGDLNHDDLVDMFIVSNEGQSGLYINKGNFKFENIIDKSGIKIEKGWSSGVTIVDINADGYNDIYLSRGGEFHKTDELQANKLFINNKNGTFSEKAEEYGLADRGATTHTTFFDYDLDGDLDAYVMNIPYGQQIRPKLSYLYDIRMHPPTDLYKFSDHFYKNIGNNKFVDATKEVGIDNYGYGLGIAISDYNKDGFPDIYITNDFESDNFYFENDRKGHFIEKAINTFGHVSYFAMGVDAADINNDELIDIYEVEMLPEKRQKSVTNMESMDRVKFETLVNLKFVPQYMRNSLQLNRGIGRFSEIAQFAGTNKTDWSWGTLLIDLDDDGNKDIFVANGIARDMKDRDFAAKGNIVAGKKGEISIEEMNALAPSNKVENYAFQNKGNLKFEKKGNDWGLNFKGFSNGVAYADFDNDGDLDLIVNNLNDYPALFKNTSKERNNNFINFKCKGPNQNIHGIGTKIKIYTDNGIQYQELYTTRGFQSSSQAILHFGLGNQEKVEKVEVIWPYGKKQTINNPKINTLVEVDFKNAKESYQPKGLHPKYAFDVTKQLNIDFTHRDKYYNDFAKEILLPQKYSQKGPNIAVGDINMDGFEDFFIGGAADQSGTIFIQTQTGKFEELKQKSLEKDKKYEDIGAILFDADQDGDNDLYVISGSNEFPDGSPKYQDRIYFNDGKGHFSRNTNALPKFTSSGSRVKAGDFDKDGDLDLFVCGKIKPGKYPFGSKSLLLVNQKGKFSDQTSTLIPELPNTDMVSDAAWTDYDNDGDLDLILVGEWMNINVYNNNNGKFKNVTSELGLDETSGWWQSISPVDFDQDGDMDFVVGNIGLNHKFKGTKEKPFKVYAGDFDDNGTNDIVLAFDQDNQYFPVRGRDCTSEQMPFITEKFPTFQSFGNAKLTDIFGDKLKKAYHRDGNFFASIILENTGGRFKIKALPVEAQLSPINAAISSDFNKDGNIDIIIAGNMYNTEPETSRDDAGMGLFLSGNGKGQFNPLPVGESGFFVPGDVKDIKKLKYISGEELILVANNNSKVKVYVLK